MEKGLWGSESLVDVCVSKARLPLQLDVFCAQGNEICNLAQSMLLL
jgi:hypothetical protein